MRIPKSWVPLIAKSVSTALIQKELLRPKISAEKFIALVDEIILEELMVEDRLNDEVRQILSRHESAIESGRIDFRKLFDLTKQKLVKERNLVL